MDGIQSPRLKLWLEGLRGFRRHGREWLGWAAGFYLVTAALCFVMVSQLHDRWQALPPGPHTANATMMTLAPGLGWIGAIELVLFLQYYFFTVLFSNREMKIGQPVLGIGRFFYSFLQAVLVSFILLALGMVFGILIFVLKKVLAADPDSAKFASIAGHIIEFGLLYYLGIKFTFVYVLAVNKMRPVLKTSWQLTEGNWWRLCWNAMVVFFLVALFIIAAIIVTGLVSWLLRTALGIPPMGHSSFLCIALIASLAITLFMGVYAAYRCIACRILFEEKREVNPSFALTATP